MITKSVNAGCRSETTLNTFSDHDSSPGPLELPGRTGRPLATHTLRSHGPHPTPHDNTQDSPTVALAVPMTREDLNLAALGVRPGPLAGPRR
jgi:hypothetical protein